MAATFLGLLVLAAAVIMLESSPPRPPAASATSSDHVTSVGEDGGLSEDADEPATSGGTSPARAGFGAPCPALPAEDQTYPVGRPSDTRWHTVDDQRLPHSPTAGPAQASDGLARCYARTPTGAVFAAVQHSWRYRQTDNWGSAAQFLLAVGPGRDAYLAQRAGSTGANAPAERTPLQLLGFRVVEYSPDAASIAVVSGPAEGPDRREQTWQLSWSEGDWRLVLPADGTPPQETPTPADAHFVPWDRSTVRQ